MNNQIISSDFPFKLLRAKVLDARMAYIDTAPGILTSTSTPIMLFLHDNPTSCYLWRNIIPYVSSTTRCIAPDLIGMGASNKLLHLAYRFVDHALYLDEFIAAVLPPSQPVVLVVQGWGAALGLHWARRNAHRIAGLVLMEFIPPLTWEMLESNGEPHPFRMFQDPIKGRKLIEDNFFVEKFLPGGVVRGLTEAEMEHYRAPFLELDTREPVYRWPNEAPMSGQPAEVAAVIQAYHIGCWRAMFRSCSFMGRRGLLLRRSWRSIIEGS